jgi:hypothetical protein
MDNKEKQYSFTMTEENKNKVEQFLKLLNIDTDIIEAENVKQPEKEWPQDGDNYYFLFSEGAISDDCFNSNDSTGERRLAIGNCFKTREEAEFEAEEPQ